MTRMLSRDRAFILVFLLPIAIVVAALIYAPALDKYACGWIVDRGERGGTKVSHSGGVRGYRCQIARWLEDDLLVVVLTNDKGEPHAVEAAVARAAFANG